ncbi:MAG: NAD(P)/FAD-dependent oxidoreductase [Actinomycetota bacterium]|nr:NAD(P)/FAD-dependent oxidoreductase [Actinomycetota bacterium]
MGRSDVDTGVVVVGASLAGLRTAEILRRRGYQRRITLIGAERHLPYDRPPLSKDFLADGGPGAVTYLSERDAFSELDIDLRLGVTATGLDVEGHRVLTGTAGDLRYEQLVIATGASPRPAPCQGELAGFQALRTLEDAQALRTGLDQARHVVILGGGFIGAEVAVAARLRSLPVTLVEILPAPMSRALGTQVGNLLARMHADHGVDVRCGVTVDAAFGSGRVETVELSDGTRLPADLVVVGLGVTPSTGWLSGSGLDITDGIACDENLRALGQRDIYAAGDVARWPHPLSGQAMRVEHWTNAIGHAEVVASQIVGPGHVADAVPYVWSDQYQRRIQIVGWPGRADGVTVIEDASDGRHVAVYERDGRTVGMLTVDSPRAMIKGRRAISAARPAAELIAAL